MNTDSPELQAIHAQIDEAHAEIAGLDERLRVVDQELDAMAAQREQHELLQHICASLDKLDELGAASLFWGEQAAANDMAGQLARVRGSVAQFQEKVSAVEDNRRALQDRVHEVHLKLGFLAEELLEQQEREEAAKNEYVVEREMAVLPYRAPIMPWQEDEEDRWRFRKTLWLSLLFTLLIGFLISVWTLPVRDKDEPIEIPERLVQLVKKEPPKPQEERKPEPEKKDDKPKQEEKEKARAKAEESGVLAFKDAFSDLMDDAPTNLGADARVSNAGQKNTGQSQRALVVAQARATSGGINTSSLSRNVAGTGKQVSGVAFSRVASAVGDLEGSDRPLSSGPGPSRTDEEIQIVFDRYKAALYRIYNRELRSDPTLRGKMILRITIEPDGTVSACRIDSTDLNSKALSTEVVDRVKKFNFGPKDGVPRITILYPIDFLPAT